MYFSTRMNLNLQAITNKTAIYLVVTETTRRKAQVDEDLFIERMLSSNGITRKSALFRHSEVARLYNREIYLICLKQWLELSQLENNGFICTVFVFKKEKKLK